MTQRVTKRASRSHQKNLYLPEARAAADLLLAMDRCKRAYNLAWAKLQITFPHDPSLVESFFTKLSRRSPAHEEPAIGEVEPEVVARDLGVGLAGDGE